MALPAPNLDDRRFQDLVDDAKRLVQQRCPEWTDHNVSDPGVTLIETFAVHDRPAAVPAQPGARPPLREVPRADRRAPAPARRRPRPTSRSGCPRPSRRRVGVPVGTEVATLRTETDEAIAFTVVDDLRHRPVPAGRRWPSSRGRRRRSPTGSSTLRSGQGFACFDQRPAGPATPCSSACPTPCPAAPSSCGSTARSRASASTPTTRRSAGRRGTAELVALRARPRRGRTARRHRRPQPGRRRRRSTCPGDHVAVAHRRPAGRLAALPGHRGRRGPARLQRVARSSAALGLHHRRHDRGSSTPSWSPDEILGMSEGVPGQRFPLRAPPGRARERAGRCSRWPAAEGWEEWTPVESFADSGPGDRHFVLDHVGGRGRASARPCGRPTGRCASTARCRPRAPPSGCPSTAPAAAAGATSPAGRSPCSSRRSRTSPGSRTGGRRPGGSTARTSTRPRCAARSCCAPGTGP